MDRIPVLIAYGEVLQLVGDSAAARDALLRAAHAAVEEGRTTDIAHALGGGVAGFEVPSADDEQADLLREADRALPAEEEGLRAAVRARLSLVLAGPCPTRTGSGWPRARWRPAAARELRKSSARRWPRTATRSPGPTTSRNARPPRPG